VRAADPVLHLPVSAYQLVGQGTVGHEPGVPVVEVVGLESDARPRVCERCVDQARWSATQAEVGSTASASRWATATSSAGARAPLDVGGGDALGRSSGACDSKRWLSRSSTRCNAAAARSVARTTLSGRSTARGGRGQGVDRPPLPHDRHRRAPAPLRPFQMNRVT